MLVHKFIPIVWQLLICSDGRRDSQHSGGIRNSQNAFEKFVTRVVRIVESSLLTRDYMWSDLRVPDLAAGHDAAARAAIVAGCRRRKILGDLGTPLCRQRLPHILQVLLIGAPPQCTHA